MFLQTIKSALFAACAALAVSACHHAGSSADPPAGGLTLTEGDGRINVEWAMTHGVEYWLFFGPTDRISPDNWTNVVGSNVIMTASSPVYVTGLLNGTTYSFSVNGRTNGGPGGAGTPSKSKVPRPAGGEWQVNTALPNTPTMRGVATNGTSYVAVGADSGGTAGVVYTGTDAQNWTASSAAFAPLNAVTHNPLGVFVAVGSGGKLYRSTDLTTWTDESAVANNVPTTNNLNAVANNGSSLYVAVGDQGTILHSPDGVIWTSVTTSPTAQNLYGVIYAAFGTGTSGTWLAVGANGTILMSNDGAASTWTQVRSIGNDLKGIAYGGCATVAGATVTHNAYASGLCLVAVGNGGTVLTADASITTNPLLTAWDTRSLPGNATVNLNAVIRGSQFVAVGDNSQIYYTTDPGPSSAAWTQGSTWLATAVPATPLTSAAPTQNLYAIARSAYAYSVVGAAGENLYGQ